MTSITLLSTVLILWCGSLTDALTCDSCGRECLSACGTRNFRTCCFNYLKKRSVEAPVTSEMQLELFMVVPELVNHYPSLKNLLPDGGESSESIKFMYKRATDSED